MISLKSKKQNSVVLSTCKVGFIAILLVSQEALYLRARLRTMNLDHLNQSSIVLAKNPVIHQRLKHIDIKFQFIHDEINKGSILSEYVETEKNVADVFMKPMTGIKLNTFRKIIRGN